MIKTEAKMEKILKNQVLYLPLKEGDTAEGSILSKTRNRIWVDVEGRGIGMIPPREIPFEAEDLKIGEKIIAFVLKPEDEKGHIILSLKKADREKIWLNLKRKFEDQENIFVKVVEANRGGLMVETSGAKGFLPLSQLSSKHYPHVGGDKEKILEKLAKLVGLKLDVKIISFDQQALKLIFSEKKASSKVEKEKIASLKVGTKISGTVSGVVDFGIFVRFNLGEEGSEEYEGLVHISEVSWSKVEDIKKEFKIGQKIDAEIISTEEGRISLSIKRLLPDPWVKKVKKYKTDQKIFGKITRVTPFGAFVQLEKDIEGLVHISEIGDEHITDPRSLLEEGQEKEFRIISIEPGAHKIGLSLNIPKSKK
ncbi:MAG TPA: S1 RNA-binding domain-containing protein [Patescibacteria group bacterium]|nr:S1 RNA-binding domain-containing protein [Patescibacteria group bacterium]